MSKKDKLLFVCSRFPFPLDKGDKLRAYHQIRFLSKKFDVVLVATDQKKINPQQIQELKKFCKEIYAFKVTKLEMAWNILKSLFVGIPLQVGYFYSYKAHKKINDLLGDADIKFSVFQLLRTAIYQDKKENKSIAALDYMDALSVGMERRFLKERNWWLQPIIYLEAKLLKNYERKVYEKFDKHFIISEEDKNLLTNLKDKKLYVNSNGIDTDYFQQNADYSKKQYDIVFVGNMSYAPNIVAVNYMAEKIIPELPENIRFLIAGASPTSKVKKLANKNITVSGWIDDIREAYSKANIFVAPMKTGTGLQNKLLEAMAMGVPCITTKLCNKALKATEGQEILLADNDDELARKIMLMMLNEVSRKEIGSAGRRFVIKNYSWENNVNEMIEVLKS